MITALLSMNNENDFEDEIFAKIMLEEQSGVTMTLQSFVELVESES